MIEIIYNESGKNSSTVLVKPPKNIRQIGSPRGRHKIYMEDYVYTFLHSSAFEKETRKRAAVLLGKSELSQDIRYTFISGAVSCNDFVFHEEGILFHEDCWEYIYKEIKQYFDKLEIVGWFLEIDGFALELTPAIEAVHRKYFAGRDKVLFLSEPSEGEDVFYAYEQGVLQKKEGYYIYYEKNISMQEYMVCTREKAREREGGIESHLLEEQDEGLVAAQIENAGEVKKEKNIRISEAEKGNAEEAIQNYRSMLQERRPMASQRKMSLLLYTAASAAMVVLCVIGITTMNNYEKMRKVEETLSVITQTSGEEMPGQAKETEVIVESIPGTVTPKPDKTEEELQSVQPQDDTVDQSNLEEDGTEGADGQVLEENQTEEQIPDEEQTEEQPQDEQTSESEQQEAQWTMAQVYLEQGYYEVQPGDKLELICKNIYQTTAMLDKLCEVNQITDMDKIYIGQKLILP